MDPVQNAAAAFLNAIQAAQAAQGAQSVQGAGAPVVLAGPQGTLAALLGQDVNLLFQGSGPDGLLFSLPSGQTVTAQGSFPFPEGTQVLAHIAPSGDGVRLQTLQATPPTQLPILAPLTQGEGLALQARLTQPDPPPALADLVQLYQELGGSPPREAPVAAGTDSGAVPSGAASPGAASPGAASTGAAPPSVGTPLQPAAANPPPGPLPAQATALPSLPSAQGAPGSAPSTASSQAAAPGLGTLAAQFGEPALQPTGGPPPQVALGPDAARTALPPDPGPGSQASAGEAAPTGAGAAPQSVASGAPPSVATAAWQSGAGGGTQPGAGPAAAPDLPVPLPPALAAGTPALAPAVPLPASLASVVQDLTEPAAPAGPGQPLATPAESAPTQAVPADPALTQVPPTPQEAFQALLRNLSLAPDPAPPARSSADPALLMDILGHLQAATVKHVEAPAGQGEALVQVLRNLLGRTPDAPAARAAAAPNAQASQAAQAQTSSTHAAAPESWEAWMKAGMKTLSDPQASPREAAFHAAQAKEGTSLFELPLPWASQGTLQIWTEKDAEGKGGKGGQGGPTDRVLLGMSFTRLGETRLGIAKGPEGLQVRVWAEHPEALLRAQPGMEEELKELDLPVDLKILPLEPGAGGGIPSIRSLASGSTFQVLG